MTSINKTFTWLLKTSHYSTLTKFVTFLCMHDSAQMFIPQNTAPQISSGYFPSQTPNIPNFPPKRSFDFSNVSVKAVAGVSLFVLLIIGGGMYAMSLKNTTDKFQSKIFQRNEEIAELLDESPKKNDIELIGKAQANYENPFDEETSYENPFDENENPFE